MKKLKKIGIIAASSFTLATTTITCIAAESYVQNIYIDSNSWTSITNATKQYEAVNPEVEITQILDTNGMDAGYKKVKVKIMCNGMELCSKTIEKGKYRTMEVPELYQHIGYMYKFYGMGNNPKLDCKISGHFNAH